MPVAKRPAARPGYVVPWVGNFLSALTEGKSVTDAAQAAGIAVNAAYSLRRSNREFRSAWKRAADLGTSMLEQEAYRRAYHGTDEPVFFKGEVCGTVRKYSDGLMTLLLKARKPEKYRDMVEQGKGGVNVAIQANIDAMALVRDMVARGELVEGPPPEPPRAETVAIAAGPAGPNPC